MSLEQIAESVNFVPFYYENIAGFDGPEIFSRACGSGLAGVSMAVVARVVSGLRFQARVHLCVRGLVLLRADTYNL